MVRHVIADRAPTWKALAAIVVAGGALLWHLLACVESPMAFSPDGKKLALVTMEPYGDNDILLMGAHTYRLMVLEEERRLRVLEETSQAMLTAPAYSPDGKQMCYLRLGLLSKEDLRRLEACQAEQQRLLSKVGQCVWPGSATTQPASAPTTQAAARPAGKDLALPSVKSICELGGAFMGCPKVPATLVLRDVASDAVVSTVPIELPVSNDLYIMIRPEWSPDGEWIYVAAGFVQFAVKPSGGEPLILAAGVWTSSLSPDGKMLAVLQSPEVYGFVQTDGQATWYGRWREGRELSLGGLSWTDAQTVAVLEEATDEVSPTVHLVRTDGTIQKSIVIAMPGDIKVKEGGKGEFAFAPNGRRAVISWGNDVVFVDADGKVLKHWHRDKEQMVQPTFRPDSKAVAFKCMTENAGKPSRVYAIAFWTPEGAEISRMAVPAIAPGATQAATQSAGVK